MLKPRQMKMVIQAMQEGGGQGVEAEGEEQAEEEKSVEAERLQVLLERMRMGRATVMMGCAMDTTREQSSGLVDMFAEH